MLLTDELETFSVDPQASGAWLFGDLLCSVDLERGLPTVGRNHTTEELCSWFDRLDGITNHMSDLEGTGSRNPETLFLGVS